MTTIRKKINLCLKDRDFLLCRVDPRGSSRVCHSTLPGIFTNNNLPTATSANSVFGTLTRSLKKREGVTKCTPLFRPSAKCQLNIRQMMVVALAERIYEY
jgi:hypothetical protein